TAGGRRARHTDGRGPRRGPHRRRHHERRDRPGRGLRRPRGAAARRPRPARAHRRARGAARHAPCAHRRRPGRDRPARGPVLVAGFGSVASVRTTPPSADPAPGHPRRVGPVGVPGEEAVAGGTARWLRLGQHALLAALAVVCLTRAVDAGTPPAAEAAGLVVLVTWYLAGVPLARHGLNGTAWFVVLTL